VVSALDQASLEKLAVACQVPCRAAREAGVPELLDAHASEGELVQNAAAQRTEDVRTELVRQRMLVWVP